MELVGIERNVAEPERAVAPCGTLGLEPGNVVAKLHEDAGHGLAIGSQDFPVNGSGALGNGAACERHENDHEQRSHYVNKFHYLLLSRAAGGREHRGRWSKAQSNSGLDRKPTTGRSPATHGGGRGMNGGSCTER